MTPAPATHRLELSTRMVYSIRHLSGPLHVHWNELLHFLFHDELSTAQVNDLEVAAALKRFPTENESINHFTAAPINEQRWILGTLKCLLAYASELGDIEGKKGLRDIVRKCAASHPNLTDPETDRVFEDMRRGFLEFTKRKYFLVPGSIWLFTLDFVLRWVALIVSNEWNAPHFRIGVNFFIPGLVLVLALIQQRKDYQHNLALIHSRNDKLFFGFRHYYSTAQYTTLALYLASGTIIASLVFDSLWGGLSSLIGLALYYFILMQVFPVGKLREVYLENQISGKSSEDYKDADENDERMVLLETQLTSSTGRLEAYVLESALFGALAFSAFLQIFATNLISFADVEKFAFTVQHVAHGFILGDATEFTNYLPGLNTKETLFSLISIETLVCSGLFVAVIASRLRFSHVADRMRTVLNLAKAYNEKEERLLESDNPSVLTSERFSKVNRRVHDQLELAAVRLQDIDPIVKYIVYFRNMGVFVFATVLITSCLFISGALAWAFLLVVAITWIYFNYGSIKLWVSGLGIRARLLFAKYGYALLPVTLLPAGLGFLLRVGFGMDHTGGLISLTLVLLAVYLGGSAFLTFYDPRFGEIKAKNWPTMQFFFGLTVLVIGLGLTMRSIHLEGANEILLVGIAAMMLLNVVLSVDLTTPKWLSFIWAFMLIMATGSFLFWTLHWAGWPEMVGLSTWMIPLCWLVYFIRRKLFHKLFIKILIVNTVVVLLIARQVAFYAVDSSLLESFKLMYQHQTVGIRPLLAYINGIEIDFSADMRNVSEGEIRRSISVCDDYLKTYGTSRGATDVYRMAINMYETIAGELAVDVHQKADSVSLTKALLAIEEADKIAVLFNYEIRPDVGIKASILEQMGRGEEEIRYYEKIVSLTNDDDLKENVQKALAHLRNGN